MLGIPNHGHRGSSGKFRDFRWPSFSEPPAFEPTTGFRVPEEAADAFLPVSLVAPGFDARSHSSSSASKVASPGKTFRGNISRQSSAAATSIALLDLYESDEEEEARRREKETPWESLRHKSIKRNILEQVEKEKKWMDSIRSTFADSSRPSDLDACKFSRIEDDVRTVRTVSVTPVAETSVTPLGRRRGHIRADSDLFTDSVSPQALGTTAPLRVRNPSSRFAQRQRQENTAPESARVPTGAHRTSGWFEDKDKNQDRHSPLPTNESRSRSRRSSQSASPVKSLPSAQNNLKGPVPIRRDVLPQSETQLMSRPLKSPIPPVETSGTSNKVQTPRPVGPRSHSRTRSSGLTKIPGPSNGRKSVGEGIKSLRPEHTRDRLVNKVNASPDATKSDPKKMRSRTSAVARFKAEPEEDVAIAESDEAMRKVD